MTGPARIRRSMRERHQTVRRVTGLFTVTA
jgi:hypothetical protein